MPHVRPRCPHSTRNIHWFAKWNGSQILKSRCSILPRIERKRRMMPRKSLFGPKARLFFLEHRTIEEQQLRKVFGRRGAKDGATQAQLHVARENSGMVDVRVREKNRIYRAKQLPVRILPITLTPLPTPLKNSGVDQNSYGRWSRRFN